MTFWTALRQVFCRHRAMLRYRDRRNQYWFVCQACGHRELVRRLDYVTPKDAA